MGKLRHYINRLLKSLDVPSSDRNYDMVFFPHDTSFYISMIEKGAGKYGSTLTDGRPIGPRKESDGKNIPTRRIDY